MANTFVAVEAGLTWIQGTINGYGPRCGWANLCSVLPGLELKLGHHAVWREQLEKLTGLAHFVAGAASLPLQPNRPYVGREAFAGLSHQDAIPYHHTRPEYVGNRRVMLVSDLLSLARGFTGGPMLEDSVQRELHDRVAQLETEGYDIEDASGTFELLAREAANPGLRPFEVVHFEVSTRQSSALAPACSEAAVTLLVGECVLSATAQASGPVHALDLAMRQCLGGQFPSMATVRLIDYRVQMLDHDKGSAARARVSIEWTDGARSWNTMGASRRTLSRPPGALSPMAFDSN